MTVYDLKPAFQNLLRPLAARLVAMGLRANQITLAALLLSFAMAAALALAPHALWPLWLLPLVLFVRMALNALDGMMAREFGQKSLRGAYYNEIGDLLSDSALILSMAALEGLSLIAAVAFALGAILSEYAGVLSQALRGRRRYEGPMGKSDRALFLGSYALLRAMGILPPGWSDPLFFAAAALTLPTTLNRMKGERP
ncbi:CDP-alcohol phosphatidyltransferase family protein [Nitratifractor sp.]